MKNMTWGHIPKNIVLEESQQIARVIEQNRQHYKLAQGDNIFQGQVTGKLRKDSDLGLPAIGDWVLFEKHDELALIHRILPRNSMLSRKVAGSTTVEQPLAANIQWVAIVMALGEGRNYNIRALERYLTIAWDSGAVPLVLINKADLVDDPEVYQREAEVIAPGVDVLLTSAQDGRGVIELSSHFQQGDTVVLIGPSGVGKSALTNGLIGSTIRDTGAVREGDSRGRHTTTTSRLVPLPNGALLIDSPGLREVQLWAEKDSLDSVFQEIAQLSQGCRFRDCAHQGEPGCAVQDALNQGGLDPDRFESYLELRKEIAYLESRKGDRKKGKDLSKIIRYMKDGKAIY